MLGMDATWPSVQEESVNQPASKKPEPVKKPDFERSLARLEEAEGRVEILLKKADGKMAAEPFEPGSEGQS